MNKQSKSVALNSEYNSHPILTLDDGSGATRQFSFGLKKARLIIAHIKDIKDFVSKADHDR